MRQTLTDDDTPRDLDELTRRLRRQIGTVDRRAIHCDNWRCRRARYCLDVTPSCTAPSPASPTTAAQNAEMLAQLQQAVGAELAPRP